MKDSEKVTFQEKKELEETLMKSWGTKVIWISTETEEGEQFYNMGGIGGLLRWQID